MALMSPEALMATKLAINRGADAAGLRNAIQSGLDVLAALYAARTEVGTTFDEIREKEGLTAALRWRAAQFKEQGPRSARNGFTFALSAGPTRSVAGAHAVWRGPDGSSAAVSASLCT
jgi:hypothetical protein